MQRAGSEAVSAGKPLITSNTKMLKNYFTKGTIFVDNTAKGIVEGIEKLRIITIYMLLKFFNSRKKEEIISLIN